jgi:hypothetical protein
MAVISKREYGAGGELVIRSEGLKRGPGMREIPGPASPREDDA